MMTSEVLRNHSGKHGSLVFAVRRPGKLLTVVKVFYVKCIRSCCVHLQLRMSLVPRRR